MKRLKELRLSVKTMNEGEYVYQLLEHADLIEEGAWPCLTTLDLALPVGLPVVEKLLLACPSLTALDFSVGDGLSQPFDPFAVLTLIAKCCSALESLLFSTDNVPIKHPDLREICLDIPGERLTKLRKLEIMSQSMGDKVMHMLLGMLRHCHIQQCLINRFRCKPSLFRTAMILSLPHLVYLWHGDRGDAGIALIELQHTLPDGSNWPFVRLLDWAEWDLPLQLSPGVDEDGRTARDCCLEAMYKLLCPQDRALLAAWNEGDYDKFSKIDWSTYVIESSLWEVSI